MQATFNHRQEEINEHPLLKPEQESHITENT